MRPIGVYFNSHWAHWTGTVNGKWSFTETKLGTDLPVQKLDGEVKPSAAEPTLPTLFFASVPDPVLLRFYFVELG